MLRENLFIIATLIAVSGCQTTNIADPSYTWTMSDYRYAHFNVPAATNNPLSSVTIGFRGNGYRSSEKWNIDCGAGDIVIEHLPFHVYDRKTFNSIKDEEAFTKRFKSRLPSEATAYNVESINVVERLASGHTAYYQNEEGKECEHSLVIMRAKRERKEATDSGFVDTIIDIDYCDDHRLDTKGLITNLEVYSDSSELTPLLSSWQPDQCPSVNKSFSFKGALDTTSYAMMALSWKPVPKKEKLVVEFRSNKREGVFDFIDSNRVSCSGSYQSATDFPNVQGEWDVTCEDGNTATGRFVAAKPGEIAGVGYDANGRIVRFSFDSFVLNKEQLVSISKSN